MDLTGVRLILVNAFEDYDDRGSKQQMVDLLRQLHVDWPVVDGGPELRKAFGVSQIPSLFVYDAGGALVQAFRRHQRPTPSSKELSTYLSSP